MKTELREKKTNIILPILLVALILLVGSNLFYKLPNETIDDDDEAWHAVNAYEMYQNNTFLVNTHRGEVDYYNTKPPLALWGTILAFRCLGPSIFTLKLTSAIAGFLTFLLCLLFIYKEFNVRTAIYFASSYLSMDLIYRYHGFRTANLDGVYVFFFTASVLSLYLTVKNNRYIILLAFCIACAFLTKCAHIASLGLIVLLALPLLWKKWNWKNFFFAVAVGVIPILGWGVARYRYDGTKFLYGTIQEIIAKTSAKPSLEYFRQIGKEHVFIVFVFLVLGYVCIIAIGKTNDIKNIWKEDLRQTYIVWLWVLIPIISYTVSGNTSSWYIYPSYIGACILVSIYAKKIGDCMTKKQVQVLFLTFWFVLGIYSGISRSYSYRMIGLGGGYTERLRELCDSVKENYGEDYNDMNIYMATPYRTEGTEGVNSDWYTDFMALFDIYFNMNCLDGGVEAYLSDGNGLLIIDNSLWDIYAEVLTGYYIVADEGDYYLFSSQRYEDM